MANAFQNETDAPEMETLAELAENLVYRLPGCPDVMVRKALREAYRDFCRRSCCLRTFRRRLLRHQDALVAVLPVFGGIVDAVTDVTLGGRRLALPADYTVMGGGTPVVALAPTLLPDPDTPESELRELVIGAIEIPKVESENAPAWFVQKYGDAVCNGALFRLFSIPNRPWSDPQTANICKLEYDRELNDACCRSYTGGPNSTALTPKWRARTLV